MLTTTQESLVSNHPIMKYQTVINVNSLFQPSNNTSAIPKHQLTSTYLRAGNGCIKHYCELRRDQTGLDVNPVPSGSRVQITDIEDLGRHILESLWEQSVQDFVNTTTRRVRLAARPAPLLTCTVDVL
ncbi:UNVERIFIED_CONTAM: hypothetical protein FKN15_032001 [Acipenser sinensis]